MPDHSFGKKPKHNVGKKDTLCYRILGSTNYLPTLNYQTAKQDIIDLTFQRNKFVSEKVIAEYADIWNLMWEENW